MYVITLKYYKAYDPYKNDFMGLGILYNQAGDNDYGFATGKYPTNYGDPGIFDAWSQGVGMGFRHIASGGIGMVVSGGGDNHWEGGSFSQGGGYYYGMGIFRAGGDGDDTYIGSRYAQGFSAHQAIGAFIEDGGDDTYRTRHMASIGLAWDESVSFFHDKGAATTITKAAPASRWAPAHTTPSPCSSTTSVTTSSTSTAAPPAPATTTPTAATLSAFSWPAAWEKTTTPPTRWNPTPCCGGRILGFSLTGMPHRKNKCLVTNDRPCVAAPCQPL